MLLQHDSNIKEIIFEDTFLKLMTSPFQRIMRQGGMLLQEKHIALWNVLLHCEREGSADYAICNEQPNDFDGLHEKYPEIRNIFFESKSAATYFKKHCGFKEGIICRILPSTIGPNAGMYDCKLEEWKALTHSLINRQQGAILCCLSALQ